MSEFPVEQVFPGEHQKAQTHGHQQHVENSCHVVDVQLTAHHLFLLVAADSSEPDSLQLLSVTCGTRIQTSLIVARDSAPRPSLDPRHTDNPFYGLTFGEAHCCLTIEVRNDSFVKEVDSLFLSQHFASISDQNARRQDQLVWSPFSSDLRASEACWCKNRILKMVATNNWEKKTFKYIKILFLLSMF